MGERRTVAPFAILMAFAGVAAWVLYERRGGEHHSVVAVALAVAVGLVMRRAVHDPDDERAPVDSALIALFAMIGGEYLTLRASPFHALALLMWAFGAMLAWMIPRKRLLEIQTLAARREAERDDQRRRRREAPAPPRRARVSVARTECQLCERMVDASTTTATARGIACSRCQPRAGEARIACNACDELVDPSTTSSLEHIGIVCDGCRPELVRRRAVTGGGRVRCEVCDELVNAETTSGLEDRSIVCEPCYQELEVGPNRDASFR